MKNAFKYGAIAGAALMLGIGSCLIANAAGANLSVSPSTGSFSAGATITADVMLDSGGGVGVNAADGNITFDPTLLSVQSVSKGDSVFNLWVADPTFSNTDGSINFSGGSNNAYTGNSGNIITITFKALKAGSASLQFASATALAADGQGTNILNSATGATFTLGGSSSKSTNSSPAAASSNSGSSAAASSGGGSSSGGGGGTSFIVTIPITSPTHPNPTQWYNNADPQFTWQLTPDVAGVSTAFDQKTTTIPKRTTEGLISSKQYSNIGEGAWYFHVRFEDALGDWSDPVNYQVNIDLSPPLPFTVVAAPGAGVDGRTELMFNASDTVSGIDHYVLGFDTAASTTIALTDVQNGVFTAQPLLPGKHLAYVFAVDKAGNTTEADTSFVLQGVAMPEVTNFPATVIERSPIVLEGTADNGANVTLDVTDPSGKLVSEGKMVSDETGHWLDAVEGGLPTGKYTITVTMVTTQGAIASSSPALPMSVISAPFLDRFGWALIVLLIAIIAGLIGFGFYKKKLIEIQLGLAKRENSEARERTKAVFEALREEMDEQVSHMEGGAAQAQGEEKLEPERVLDSMRNALAVSESTVQKEIDDVDKALNENDI